MLLTKPLQEKVTKNYDWTKKFKEHPGKVEFVVTNDKVRNVCLWYGIN